MQIYYNEPYNEIILNKEGFDTDTISNHGLFKETYSLGALLVDFIELDFDKIIQTTENKLNQPIPQTYDLIPDHILKIRKTYEWLKSIHPYFWSYNFDFEEEIGTYEYHLIRKIKYREIFSHDENWFNNEENTKLLVDDAYIRFDVLKLTNKLISFDDFKKSIEADLKISTCDELGDMWDASNELKEMVQRHKRICDRFKKAVEFCLDEDSFTDLTPLQRYCFYQSKIDTDMSQHSIGLSYKINSIDDESYEYDIMLHDIKDLLGLSSIDIVKELPDTPIKIYEVYEGDTFAACYFELMKLISKGILIRRCSNCHKYFINTSRADTLYCDRPVGEEGKTCKNVGAMNQYREKVMSDPIMEIYQKHYKKNYARTKYKSESKKMSKSAFEIWSNKAMAMRDKAKTGEMTFEEFKQWLNRE